MPELPEVEVIKLGLEKKIVGLTLKKIQILNPKTFQGDYKKVEGLKVVGVWRRAKMLGVNLDVRGPAGSQPHAYPTSLTSAGPPHGAPRSPSPLTLLFHLKMTGQLVFVPQIHDKRSTTRLIGGHPTEDMIGQMPNKHTRVIFEFSDQSKLYFNDQRKFGWVKVIQSAKFKVQSENILGKLGPEPLEKSFTWQIFKQNLLRHKNLPIKVAMMNQEVVAGVGNIYASEALFDAKIDPRRKVNTLSDIEFQKLLEGMRKAFETSIKAGGSTRAHFVDSEGKKGYFLDFANVYGKAGQKCHNCEGKVLKITQAGRGTFYCEHCQK